MRELIQTTPTINRFSFDVWLFLIKQEWQHDEDRRSKEQWLIAENERLTKENENAAYKDMHRIDSARQVGNNSMRGNGCTGRSFDNGNQ